MTWVPRLDKLYVKATCNGRHTHAELDGLDECTDEYGSPCPMPVEGLRYEEQGAVLAEGFKLTEHPLEEEKGIFERHMLIKKGRTGSQQDDESHLL